MTLPTLLDLIERAAEIADALGLREALTLAAVLEQVRHVEASGETLIVRDLRTKEGKDHG